MILDFDAGAGDRIMLAGVGYTPDQDGTGNAVLVFSATDSVMLLGVHREQVVSGWLLAA